MSKKRVQVIDPSVPLFIDFQGLAYKSPLFDSDLLGFIKPFTLEVRTKRRIRTRTMTYLLILIANYV